MDFTREEIVREAPEWMRTQLRDDVHIADVAGLQIIKALLRVINRNFATGYMYRILQDTANEARERGLLINPNPFTLETYSTAVGNTDRMHPSTYGWEQAVGILRRRFNEAKSQVMRTCRHVANHGLLVQTGNRLRVSASR